MPRHRISSYGATTPVVANRLWIVASVIFLLAALGPSGAADEPRADAWANPILTERFAPTHALIKPQPGEARWRDIPWEISLWKARQRAAAEGKPMFVWAGSGGAPCAPT
jgi:hypothetical protein